MATQHNMGLVAAPFFADEALDDHMYYLAQPTASAAGFVEIGRSGCNPYPLGIIQDNGASAASQTVSVGLFGTMTAKVAACDNAGNACPITAGMFLRASSAGHLIKAGSVGDVPCARALGAITSSCSIANIEVYFFGGIPGASLTTTL